MRRAFLIAVRSLIAAAISLTAVLCSSCAEMAAVVTAPILMVDEAQNSHHEGHEATRR